MTDPSRDTLQFNMLTARASYESAQAAYAARLNRDRREAEARGYVIVGKSVDLTGTETVYAREIGDVSVGTPPTLPSYGSGDDGGYTETTE